MDVCRGCGKKLRFWGGRPLNGLAGYYCAKCYRIDQDWCDAERKKISSERWIEVFYRFIVKLGPQATKAESEARVDELLHSFNESFKVAIARVKGGVPNYVLEDSKTGRRYLQWTGPGSTKKFYVKREKVLKNGSFIDLVPDSNYSPYEYMADAYALHKTNEDLAERHGGLSKEALNKPYYDVSREPNLLTVRDFLYMTVPMRKRIRYYLLDPDSERTMFVGEGFEQWLKRLRGKEEGFRWQTKNALTQKWVRKVLDVLKDESSTLQKQRLSNLKKKARRNKK